MSGRCRYLGSTAQHRGTCWAFCKRTATRTCQRNWNSVCEFVCFACSSRRWAGELFASDVSGGGEKVKATSQPEGLYHNAVSSRLAKCSGRKGTLLCPFSLEIPTGKRKNDSFCPLNGVGLWPRPLTLPPWNELWTRHGLAAPASTASCASGVLRHQVHATVKDIRNGPCQPGAFESCQLRTLSSTSALMGLNCLHGCGSKRGTSNCQPVIRPMNYAKANLRGFLCRNGGGHTVSTPHGAMCVCAGCEHTILHLIFQQITPTAWFSSLFNGRASRELVNVWIISEKRLLPGWLFSRKYPKLYKWIMSWIFFSPTRPVPSRHLNYKSYF